MRGVTRLGLTGGIGSGKSTVARMFGELGAAVIDADQLSRDLTACGGEAIAPIAREFGPSFIGPDGALDRERMRSLAFSDPTARRRLERIIHPLVGAAAAQQAQTAIQAKRHCLVFDIPLLAESQHWRTSLDEVLVLDCQPETQIARVMQRSGLELRQVESIVASQASRSLRLHAADHVICNDKLPLDELGRLVRQLAGRFGL